MSGRVPTWAWPLGAISLFCLTPTLGLMIMQTWSAPGGPEIEEAYRVLAAEGAESPKLARWYSPEGVAVLKASEREFGRPVKMYRPEPTPNPWLGGGYQATLLVKRGETWTDESAYLPTRPGRLSAGRAQAAMPDRKASFRTVTWWN
jgi:hypothetical protein